MRRTKALLSCLLALALVMLTACGARQQTVHRLSADRVTQAATVSQLQEVSDLIVVFTPETQENVLSRYSDGNVASGYTRTTGQVTQVPVDKKTFKSAPVRVTLKDTHIKVDGS